MKEIVFEEGRFYAITVTASGKRATVFKNDRPSKTQYYQLLVDGKTVFNRGTIAKVYETLARM